jgi:hypothetical protein
MKQQLLDRLQTVQVLDAQSSGPLQVFGLRWESVLGLRYRTLDEALAAGDLEVAEVNEAGSVPTMKVTNKGDELVFLMAGEQLVGAKQNRVLNASIMVPARAELPIPVSCVEQGRWGGRTRKFGSSGTMSHGHLRSMMSKHAFASYAREGTPRSHQGEVWGEVSRKLHFLGSASPSEALEQTYDDYHDRLNEFLRRMPVPGECCGMAFAIGGRVAGVDLFDQPATLGKLWPKVVRAYALDALEQREPTAKPVTCDMVHDWLHAAGRAEAQPYKSPGLGFDVRLRGEGLIGAGLVVEEQPVHTELFPLEKSSK